MPSGSPLCCGPSGIRCQGVQALSLVGVALEAAAVGTSPPAGLREGLQGLRVPRAEDTRLLPCQNATPGLLYQLLRGKDGVCAPGCRVGDQRPGLVNGSPLRYSCLENSMDGGAWWAAVHGVTKSWTRLSDFTLTFHFHALGKDMATHSSILAWRIPGTGEPGGLPSMGSHRVGHD